ncbi:hypothetical protein [Limnoglobus roseus]|uniref:Uncharacterized protein n=1 Tax=Limnoglobus roseus TaxID=2598579 RepID=A0A5C1A6M9_9BACT|nr:hypothetical protein [Limnoglobus roseus]QEL13646.1 hypothetical protein PX52LOC_00504 [Limnoglobus roseus]
MPLTDLFAIAILPPFAIGRMGNSPDPMDNYNVSPDPNDRPAPADPTTASAARTLTPAPTLQVDRATGKITGAALPAAVRFRDADGKIKPVAPFLEVWFQPTEAAPLEPLTKDHLGELTATVEWRVNTANRKAFRRTGDANDRIEAVVDWFGDHAVKSIVGTCPNFKANKSIPFGTVQYIDPDSAGFPEVRLRFTPPAGKVYGPTAGDPNVVDDVYDATRGQWRGHVDEFGVPGKPVPTAPGSIFFGHLEGSGPNRMWVSNGYLDDASDGIVEVRVRFGAKELTAFARISAGPPTFAPDTFHLRTVADDLEQIALGPVFTGPVPIGEAVDIIHRGLETVRLFNTAAGNDNFPTRPVSNMPRHDTGFGRARETIFPPGRADAKMVRQLHEGVVEQVAGGDASSVGGILRSPEKAGDLSNAGRRKMPGMMRGSDGLHLALTRRQAATLRGVQPPAPPPAAATPEANMLKMIDHFFNRRNRHLGIMIDATRTLAELFSDKPALLNYLRTASSKGDEAGPLAGQRLIVPGNPDGSALVQLIRTPTHPMNGPLTTGTVADTGKTGLTILTEWIQSLS